MDWSRLTGVKRLSNAFNGMPTVQPIACAIGRMPASEDRDSSSRSEAGTVRRRGGRIGLPSRPCTRNVASTGRARPHCPSPAPTAPSWRDTPSPPAGRRRAPRPLGSGPTVPARCEFLAGVLPPVCDGIGVRVFAESVRLSVRLEVVGRRCSRSTGVSFVTERIVAPSQGGGCAEKHGIAIDALIDFTL